MPEMIVVGNLGYTKMALEREIRQILRSSGLGIELDAEDFRFMSEVLHFHPRAAGKIGCGLRAIRVIASKYGNRCFEVVRTDGSSEPFSIATCLGKKNPGAAAKAELAPYHENPDYEGMFKD